MYSISRFDVPGRNRMHRAVVRESGYDDLMPWRQRRQAEPLTFGVVSYFSVTGSHKTLANSTSSSTIRISIVRSPSPALHRCCISGLRSRWRGLTILDELLHHNGAYSEPKSLNFPWEGNNGQNQHYHVLATGSDVITKVVISYDPPDPLPGETVNAIGDIHNIDVTTVPEPTSLAIFGVGAFAIAGYRLRRSRLLAKEA